MKDIAKKTKAELETELSKARVTLRDIRFGEASKTKDVTVRAKLRKDIARMETALKMAQ